MDAALQKYGYVIVKKLGKGTYGSTYLVEDKYGDQYAVKIMDKIRFNRNEINLTENFKDTNDNNLVQLIDWKEDRDHYYMFMQYVPESVILTKVSDRSPKCVNTVVNGLLNAIEYLHNQGISHQDIKPPNILVDSNCDPILIDFGLSCLVDKGIVKDSFYNIKELLAIFSDDIYIESQFINMFNLVNDLDINLNYNSYSKLIKKECLNKYSLDIIKIAIVNLVELSLDPNLIIDYSPEDRVKWILKYVNGEKIPIIFKDVLDYVDYSIHKQISSQVHNENIDTAGKCENGSWSTDIISPIAINDLKDMYIIILKFCLINNIPMEIYIRSIDIMAMTITNSSKIEPQYLKLLGIVGLHIAQQQYLLDIGTGVNCLEIDFLSADYPYAPPEAKDKRSCLLYTSPSPRDRS